MVKVIFMLKRKPGISREQFRDHYEKSHSVLGRKYVGHLLLDYKRSYPIEASCGIPSAARETGEKPAAYEFPYDVVTEMRLSDRAAADEMMNIFNDPTIGPIFVEDEHRFLDRESVVTLICDEFDTGTTLQPNEVPIACCCS